MADQRESPSAKSNQSAVQNEDSVITLEQESGKCDVVDSIKNSNSEPNSLLSEAEKENLVTSEASPQKEIKNLITIDLSATEKEKDCDVAIPSQSKLENPKKLVSLPDEGERQIAPVAQKEIQVLTLADLQTRGRTKCRCVKRFSLIILLTAITFGYATGGAYLFSHLEKKREIAYNAKIDKWKNDTAILLATELRQVRPHEDIWAKTVFRYLQIFEKDILKASAIGYRREDDSDRGAKWTLEGSLFFSISLMTTTGYGSMTPRSEWGRTAVVTFSILGVPLMFSWLIVIGYFLAVYWAWMFENLCCHLCSVDPIPPNVKRFKLPEEQHKSTFKSNSVVPVTEPYKLRVPFARMESARSMDRTYQAKMNSVRPKVLPDSLMGKSINICDAGHDYDKKFSVLEQIVALIFSVLFFFVYFIFGSISFAVFEGWDIPESLYFNYLMFSTSGPGCYELDDIAEIRIKEKLSYTVFLIIGYCILSMILNLVYMCFKVPRSDKELRTHSPTIVTLSA
ncbi:Potassium channel subfamily K member 18, partial [Stegodyphus mimosarum]